LIVLSNTIGDAAKSLQNMLSSDAHLPVNWARDIYP
jgi:hypothetical protein